MYLHLIICYHFKYQISQSILIFLSGEVSPVCHSISEETSQASVPQIVAKVTFVKDIFVKEAADVKSLGNLYVHRKL